MSGDYSRYVFDPTRDYDGVLLQQGRPLTDWDWNDLVAQIRRRTQAGTFDTFGGVAVVPRTTEDGFKLKFDGGGNLTIGRGRIYVDGLLAENHGAGESDWDVALAEQYGMADTPWNQQPYIYNASQLPTNGTHLAYVDIWEREVTSCQAPELVESALAVDTTTRVQIIWQVKLVEVRDGYTGDSDPPNWSSLTAPSAGQLTTGTMTYGDSTPCLIQPGGGYTGLENQLYRVEIHDGGAPGKATFKWSRDNASVETRVTQIRDSGSTLIVESLGKDAVLSFRDGDWIEITDDWLELNDTDGPHGRLHRIKTTGGVDAATRSIHLEQAVNTTLFATDGTVQSRHTRIRRWDQSGTVLRTDTTPPSTYGDVESSGGAITVPQNGGITLALENGIVVSFDLADANGNFRTGDYWLFAARATGSPDTSLEKLAKAEPRGIHHHYAKLGVVTFPIRNDASLIDCRTIWPPAHQSGGGCCTITVDPSVLTDKNTLQDILNNATGRPNTVICLKPGAYSLSAPLRLTAGHSGISIRGCKGVMLQAAGAKNKAFGDGMVVIDMADNITLSGIQFNIPAIPYARAHFAGVTLGNLPADAERALNNLYTSIGVRAVSCSSLTIEDCRFELPVLGVDAKQDTNLFGAGVFAAGDCSGLRLERNEFLWLGALRLAPRGRLSSGTALNKGNYAASESINPFTAGYVLAPSVSLAPAATAKRTLAAAEPAKTASRAPVAGQANSGQAASAGYGTTLLKMVDTNVSPLLRGGTVQFDAWRKFLTAVHPATSLTLPAAESPAVNGGAVLPATLDDAIIEGNSFSGMTAAVFVMADTGTATVVGNSANYGGGFVFQAPQEEFGLVRGLMNKGGPTHIVGAIIAMGYPLPDNTAAKPTPVSPAAAVIRIHAGTRSVTAGTDVWTSDKSTLNVTVSAGALVDTKAPSGATAAAASLYLKGYSDPATYPFTGLPTGFYEATLKFAASTTTDTSRALFPDLYLDGALHVKGADFSEAAPDITLHHIACTGKGIVINVAGNAKAACICAIELKPELRLPDSQDIMGQFVALWQQPYAVLNDIPLNLRVDGNTVDNATSIALMVADTELTPHQAVPTEFRIYGPRSLLTVNANVFRVPATAAETDSSQLLTQVLLVDSCSITGNQMLNVPEGLSLGVAQRNAANTATGLAITGNVFRGPIGVPARFPAGATNVPPAPMDSWEFLNTKIG